jgi:hypothetical protein
MANTPESAGSAGKPDTAALVTIKQRLAEAIKTAMKSGDRDTLNFGRNLHAAVRKKEIDDRVDLDDAGVQKVIGSLAKQRQDSIEQFRQGGREDLVAKEEAELRFLMAFLPQQLSEQEVRAAVEAAIAESGAKSIKELGAVMRVLLPKVQGRADGKLVNQLVRERLGASGS